MTSTTNRGQQHLLSLLLICSILFSTTSVVRGDVSSNSGWIGCVDPENPTKKVRRGQRTTVCLGVGPDGDYAGAATYQRYSFKPITDEFSRFTIPNSYTRLVQTRDVDDGLSGNITVHTQSQSSLSFLRRYYDDQTGRVFPHLTAIIDVTDGVVKGIAWDKACQFCANNRCLENTYDFSGDLRHLDEPTTGCFLEKKECDKIAAGGGKECDLTLYVVWTGTDENKKVLSSSKFRLSAFSGKQVKSFFRDGLETIEGFADLNPFTRWRK